MFELVRERQLREHYKDALIMEKEKINGYTG